MSWLKSGIVCSLLALPALAATGGWQSLGNVSAVEALPQGAELRAGAARVRVLAQSPNVVRVRYAPKGSFPPEHSFAVLPNVFSEPPKIQVEQSADDIRFNTGAMQVKILKAPFRILFLDAKGNVISQDHAGYPVSFNGDAFRVWKSMPEDEHYFGLGDKSGPLDHRNQSFSMWNTDAYGWQESTDPLYKTIPFLLAMRGGAAYGIFLDNTYRSNFDFGKESRDFYSFGADGGYVKSITVDGVSLTVNALPSSDVVRVSIVDYTRQHTTLGALRAGDSVHLEADIIAKHVRRLLAAYRVENG